MLYRARIVLESCSYRNCNEPITHTAWTDNIKTWTGLLVEQSVRMTENRDKRREYVHGVANPRIEDGYRTEQNQCRIQGVSSVSRHPPFCLGAFFGMNMSLRFLAEQGAS